jgi:hypothetical protein
MKRTNRKLNLRVETVRNLSQGDLRRAAGGMSSERAGVCSTFDETGCCGFSGENGCGGGYTVISACVYSNDTAC